MTHSPRETSLAAPLPSPGYLMTPFGWAAQPLAAMLERDPTLYRDIFTLSRRRMHLIALTLAHGPVETAPLMGRLLIRGLPTAVLDTVFGHRPVGLKRALDRLPVQVLPAESYRHLIELLGQPAVAKLIYHVDQIGGDYIRLLHEVPAPLRCMVAVAADDCLIKPKGLTEGLRFLAARGAAPSFDALVADLGSVRQPAQMIARIANLVRQLPLPEPMPPRFVGGARRLDGVADICRLANRWKNCLETVYLEAVNDGRAAIYLWPHDQTPAVCVVARHGRLGWALEDAAGPDNLTLAPDRLDEIHVAFAAAGIAEQCAIEAIEHVVNMLARQERRQQRAGRRPEADVAEMYDEGIAAA